ncbi:MAG: arginine--tRNA ligase [Rhodospirillaceae bacterium]|nr:arginine--tRNA ligase [Rhodospirillaceae bacterium]
MRAQIDQQLRKSLADFAAGHELDDSIDLNPQLERTRDPRHGDFTTNIALRLAKPLGRPPRELAVELADLIPESTLIADVNVAGPGFINLTVASDAYLRGLSDLIEAGESYGRSDWGGGRRVIVEYVSANPTGPLHVGHGRHAAYGASLANLLRATGHEVHEEYYVNDAGRQMDILTVSVWLRYLQTLGEEIEFPRAAYRGDYVHSIARQLHAQWDDRLARFERTSLLRILADPPSSDDVLLDRIIAAVRHGLGDTGFSVIFNAARYSVLDDIRADLAEFGVRPNNWYSERSLADGGALERALKRLNERDRLYVRDGAVWFKATEYGDDKDRVVVRENGASTYFASDIAYHFEKRTRGYELLLDIMGADHHGYVSRVRAALQAMGEPGESLEVRLVQFVTLYRGKEKVQMSTRSGEFVTLRQLREEVGNDAARFFYVSRSYDQHLDFDLELAKAQSNDNPVYYVQYAHARVASLLKKMVSEGFSLTPASRSDLRCLTESAEKELLVSLSRYPEVVHLAAVNRAPTHVAQFLRTLAASFHSYYNAHRVLVSDDSLRNARVALARGVQQVLRNGLTLLGVSAPESM